MATIFIIIGFILIVLGLVGAIAPGLPGPPLSFFGLVMLELARDGRIFSNRFFIILAAIIIFVTVVENLLPIFAARVYGASKKGIYGAVIGMIAGFLFFPPFGLILGSLIGAVVGEILAGKKESAAWRSGLATLAGNVVSTVLKFTLSAVIAYYFFSRLI